MEASLVLRPRASALGARALRLRSDDVLVARFRLGDDDAFHVIHERYRSRLLAYMRQMLSASGGDAEDACQDVFVRAYGALRGDDRPVTLRAWLFRVAHNRCIDQLRRPVPAPAEVLQVSRAPERHDPAERAETREHLRRLVADVQRLPEQQRSALLMREVDGLSYAELADALGVTVPAVKSLLVRARSGLVQAGAARDTSCLEIREDLLEASSRSVRCSGRARRHVQDCLPCRRFRDDLRRTSAGLAALSPSPGVLVWLGGLLGLGGGGAAAGGGTGGVVAAGGAAAGGTAAGAAGVAASGAALAGTTAGAAGVAASGAALAGTTAAAGATAAAGGAAVGATAAAGGAAVGTGALAGGAVAGTTAMAGGAAVAGSSAMASGALAGSTLAGAAAAKVAAVVATTAVVVGGGAAVTERLAPPDAAAGPNPVAASPHTTSPARARAQALAVLAERPSAGTVSAAAPVLAAGAGEPARRSPALDPVGGGTAAPPAERRPHEPHNGPGGLQAPAADASSAPARADAVLPAVDAAAVREVVGRATAAATSAPAAHGKGQAASAGSTAARAADEDEGEAAAGTGGTGAPPE